MMVILSGLSPKVVDVRQNGATPAGFRPLLHESQWGRAGCDDWRVNRRSPLVLTGVLGLLGFLLVTAAFSARDTRRTEAPRKTALIHQIEDGRTRVADLEQAVRSLRSDVDAARLSQDRINRSGRRATERETQLA